MSDAAHEETDRLLAALEEKLRRTYKEAKKDAEGKFLRYMRDFIRKDARHRQDVADGSWTQEEYENWRRNQLLYGETLKDIRDTIATDLRNTDKIAMDVARGEQPEIYALNFNYGTYSIEKAGRVDTSFTLYDHSTVERLMRDDPKLLPKPSKKRQREIDASGLKWNQRRLTSAFTASILAGDSIPKMAKRISSVADMNENAAIRNARTMSTGAENAGREDSYKRAVGMGIDVEQEWSATLDGRTRHSHRMVDGEKIKIGEKFSNGVRFPGDPDGPAGEIYNCFVGDTPVSADSNIERSYCHMYEGELITVKTASGIEFTCTPNHPILTPGGWVCANRFHKGDNLLVTNVTDHQFPRRNPNVNHVFASIDAIHELFDVSNRKWVSRLCVNFHGDRPTSDVEIVTHKRLLRSHRNVSKTEKTNELRFKDTDTALMCKCTLVEHLRGIRKSSLRFISRLCKSLAFFWWRMSHPNVHTFRPTSNRNVVLPEYSINDLPRETVIRSELLNGLSGEVLVDNVVDVKASIDKCHVYNLQTENGYYLVGSTLARKEGKCNGNAIIAKNCRCTLIPVVSGVGPGAFDKTDTLKRKLDNADITYEEWKKQHQAPTQFRKGYTFRKKSEEGTSIIDKASYSKITKPAIKAGADIRRATDDVLKRLNEQNASAVTYGDVIYFRDDATVSDVLEETHHFFQNRKGMNDKYPAKQRSIMNEIDAKEYILSMESKYHIPKDEIKLTKSQLASYVKEKERMMESGEWIE